MSDDFRLKAILSHTTLLLSPLLNFGHCQFPGFMDPQRPLIGQSLNLDPERGDDESESEQEEGEHEEEEEEEEDDDSEEVQVARSVPARLSRLEPTMSFPVMVDGGDDALKQRMSQGGDGMMSFIVGEESEQGGWNREETEGSSCPICLEAWSNDGDHYPSCLPCGHLYGMSCIQKWFRLRRSGSSKCPQCNTQCSRKDVRRIYGSRVLVIDDESKKRIQSLEAKCDFLEKKDTNWHKKEVEWLRKEAEWQKREADLCMQLQIEKTKNLKGSFDFQGSLWRSAVGDRGCPTGCDWKSTFGSSVSSNGFALQKEFELHGARFFDIDAAGQILIIARRSSGVGVRSAITKMSLLYPHDQEDITLPLNVKVVKDMHVSPFARLALLASLGKKLSVVSLQSNNVVLNCDLAVPAWSCSWDSKSSHYVYAGLQNGMLLVFDTRQTARPLESRNGLTGNPVHTIYSLSVDPSVSSDTRKLLTASSSGLCQWTIGCELDEPFLVSETHNQGVCISLAYCSTSDYLVATYRPRIEMPKEATVSQPFLTPSSAAGQCVQGSHVVIKRMGSCYESLGSKLANVPSIRLPKSTILDMKDWSAFASADEITSELVIQELPLLEDTDRFKSYYPIRDVKYDSALRASSLICLSEDKLQLFSQKLS